MPNLQWLCSLTYALFSQQFAEKLAKVDHDTFEFIRSNGAVGIISQAMEKNPTNEALLKIGARVLQHLATQGDLEGRLTCS